MHRLSHADPRKNITIKLKVLKPYKKREVGIVNDVTLNEVVDAVMQVFAGTVTVRPDLVGGGHRLGTFGVDEPHPFPEAVEPDPNQLMLI